MLFRDRQDAGRRLAEKLARYRADGPVVLALPRGGVPVGCEVALGLGAPLDVLVVRKLPAPGNPEYGIGAVAEGGALYVNWRAARELGIGKAEVEAIAGREAVEIERRVRLYRGSRELPELAGRTVVVVDDGTATGGTARAAVRCARARGAARVVLATPVVAAPTAAAIAPEVDDLVAVAAPEWFHAVGQFYARFGQTSDEEVAAALARARAGPAAEAPQPAGGAEGSPGEREVEVAAAGEAVRGTLAVPAGARGAVVFAHGSGSSRYSPRNRRVAAALRGSGLATLLVDLLTPEEAEREAFRFDVALLALRLAAATRWLRGEPGTSELAVGYFGASTGAAAALAAAARDPAVFAVVSRGGRPDLCDPAVLARVRAPTLLLVGERDEVVRELNRRALGHLGGPKELVVVPGATHLCEEPGAREEVSRLAAGWFASHLGPAVLEPAQRT